MTNSAETEQEIAEKILKQVVLFMDNDLKKGSDFQIVSPIVVFCSNKFKGPYKKTSMVGVETLIYERLINVDGELMLCFKPEMAEAYSYVFIDIKTAMDSITGVSKCLKSNDEYVQAASVKYLDEIKRLKFEHQQAIYGDNFGEW